MDDIDGKATLSDSTIQNSTTTPKNVTKPKRRSLVERELETNLTARVTSPVITNEVKGNASCYGRSRRLINLPERNEAEKATTAKSPVYKMHASNSPIKYETSESLSSPKLTTKQAIVCIEKQIDVFDLKNNSKSNLVSPTMFDSPVNKVNKVYIKKDLIQGKGKDNISPINRSRPSTNTHLNLVLERSLEKYSLNTEKKQNGYLDTSSVVKTLDFDSRKRKNVEKISTQLSKSEIFDIEAKCPYQVGDLAWARMGTYPFWPCIVTRDPYSDTFVKKKLFGRVERDVIHVTFFGDNGRRGWIVDNMLRKFTGLQEFMNAKEKFAPEVKKKDPRLYAAFFVSDKKQATWDISVEEAETLLREPKRLRIDALHDMLNKVRDIKTTPKRQKSSRISRTDSDVSLSASLYDTLFSEDDCKEDTDKSKNRTRKMSFDVSDVVTACLDNMAAKTGMSAIQKQSHMDIWLQKAKSMTPEKPPVKLGSLKNKHKETTSRAKKSKTPLKENTPQKVYSLRRSAIGSNDNDNLGSIIVSKPYQMNEHDYSELNNGEDTITPKFLNGKVDENRCGIGYVTKVETLSTHFDNNKENNEVMEIVNAIDEIEPDIADTVNVSDNRFKEEAEKQDSDELFTDFERSCQEGTIMETQVFKQITTPVKEVEKISNEITLYSSDVLLRETSPFKLTTNGTHIIIEPNVINTIANENGQDNDLIESSKSDIVNESIDDQNQNCEEENEISALFKDLRNSFSPLTQNIPRKNSHEDQITPLDHEIVYDQEKSEIPVPNEVNISENGGTSDINDLPENTNIVILNGDIHSKNKTDNIGPYVNYEQCNENATSESNNCVSAENEKEISNIINTNDESHVNKETNDCYTLSLVVPPSNDTVIDSDYMESQTFTETDIHSKTKTDDIEHYVNDEQCNENATNVSNNCVSLDNEKEIFSIINTNGESHTTKKTNGCSNDTVIDSEYMESQTFTETDPFVDDKSGKEVSRVKENENQDTDKSDDDFALRLNEPSSIDITSEHDDIFESQTFTEIDTFVNDSTKKTSISEVITDNESNDALNFLSQTFTQPSQNFDEKSIEENCRLKQDTHNDHKENNEISDSLLKFQRKNKTEDINFDEELNSVDVNKLTVGENIENHNHVKTFIKINAINSITNGLTEKQDVNTSNDLKSDNASLDSNTEDNMPLSDVSKRIKDNITLDKSYHQNTEIKKAKGRPRKKSKKDAEVKVAKNDPEFLKYVELRQDALLDENPEFTEEDIISYLHKTWTYEESLKSVSIKSDEIEQSGLVKGLENRKRKPKNKSLSLKKPAKKVEKDLSSETSSDEEFDLVLESDSGSGESDIEGKIPISKIESSPENVIRRVTDDKEALIEPKSDYSSISDEQILPKKKVQTKPYTEKSFDRADIDKAMEDPEFLKYLEIRQDSLIDENPHLTEDDITLYLYKTWVYEEGLKSDTVKSDEVKQSTIIKGLNDGPVPQLKKAKKSVEKKETQEEIPSKAKPKRKMVKAFYNENDTDIEDELQIFEIFKIKPKIKPNIGPSETNKDSSTSETTEQKPAVDLVGTTESDAVTTEKEIEEVYDEEEFFFSELTRVKPNLFKGLLRERVCEVCEKTGQLIKCKGPCAGTFHFECNKKQAEKVVSVPTQAGRGRKRKKPRGRKPKNMDDSESQSDEKSQRDLSIEDDNIVVDEEKFETVSSAKMREIIEAENKKEYDYSSSEETLSWNDIETGKCEIIDVKLKIRNLNEHANFKCYHCSKSSTPLCFVCKSATSPKNSTELRQRCQHTHCHKYYHLECLENWPQTQFHSGDSSKSNKKNSDHFEAMSCPRHVCHTCVSDDPRGCKTRFSGDKLARCVKCPATYHSFTKCLPAGSTILTGSLIICPRHFENRPGKVPCHVNTGWCFICALGGTLICCEYCPTSFHAECLNIAPPEGHYMCEDCETGRLPLYGEMVWVKLGHYRWWPGIILHPSEIPENILAVKHSQGEFVVRFFGQYDHYWVNRGRVFPFQEGDSGRISSQKSKIDEAFTKAMEHAHRACHILKEVSTQTEEDGDIASSLRPPQYVKLRVNKAVGTAAAAAAAARRHDHDASFTRCECDVGDPTPCGPLTACLNRMLLTECGPSCRAGDSCQNRAFERREYPKLVPYRTVHRGWGLKTLQDIKQGQFVIEYVGELIDEDEFRRRMARQHEVRDENFYYLTLDKDRMIDAGPKGNLARFMNHCCEPNCETQKWTVLGDVRVGLFALHDIPANTEVTFNYNLECAGIEKKRCFCGAKRCSGYIGAKPKQEEAQPKKGKTKRVYRKRKPTESPSSALVKKTYKPRTTQRSRPKELTEIEKDLLIIKNATNGLSSDSECSLRQASDRIEWDGTEKKPLKRKRVNFSTESLVILNGDIASPTVKMIRLEHVGD